MTSYKNLAGNIGICSYEIGQKEIRVKFHSHKSVIFDKEQTNEEHYTEIEKLAKQGFGLNQYINSNSL
ncbi:MAG: hypothetical protein V3U71_13050 [Cocleimonas sp.]